MSADLSTARVLLADDHELVRRLLRRAIGAHPGLEIVGEAADGAEAVELARPLAPDVVVLDLSMPHLDGLRGRRASLRAGPAGLRDPRLLRPSRPSARRSRRGADRYLEKGAGFEAAAQAAAELAVSRR